MLTRYVKKLESPVTGETLKGFLIDCMKSANFLNEDNTPKISIWGVTDQGANIICALRALKEEGIIDGFHNCFNHKIQLVIKDGIKTTPGMEVSVKKFQDNAAIYSRSRKERKSLRDECKKNKVSCIIPLRPNGTRWFGQKIMMDGFLKREREFKWHNLESERMHALTSIDWKNAKGFSEVLQPFLVASKIEEGEKYLTLSSVIPVLHVLSQKTTSYFKNKDNNGYGIVFAKNILASLEDRFGKFPDFMLLKPHCYATFSDPRFKHVFFSRKPNMEKRQKHSHFVGQVGDGKERGSEFEFTLL